MELVSLLGSNLKWAHIGVNNNGGRSNGAVTSRAGRGHRLVLSLFSMPMQASGTGTWLCSMSSMATKKRDRSKSLAVDGLTPLLRVPRPKSRDEGKWQGSKGQCQWPSCVRPQSQPPSPSRPGARRLSSSSSSELGCRRGVFSRRHFGSVELLAQMELDGADPTTRRFRVENGERPDKDELYNSPSTPVLENPEYQTRWYFKYFLGKLHENYVGMDVDKTPFLLSVGLSDASNQCLAQYRAILWKKTGAQKICIPYAPHKAMTVKQILGNFPNMEKVEKGPKEIFTPEIQKDLLLLEEQEGSVNFKFGVLYAKADQVTDDEMYSNDSGSKRWEKFIALLGDKIRLRGWDKYRGGLDVKGDMTGRHSVYTIFEGHEIMFHVSTLLPYSPDNRQQVERKRHIGNDIVNIIFFDCDNADSITFKPSLIKTQFTHIFAIVSYNHTDDSYRLCLFSEETVPLFSPTLPCPPVFHNHQEFREFLLVKMINGEKAAFNTPTFAQKRERTLDMLIKDLYGEHITDTRTTMTMLNRRAFSDVLPDPPRTTRRKEEARQVEFVRFGQALKLDTIVKGDAPTSLATTSLFKREPWEPQCFYPDFPFDVICGDSWGDSRLVLGTDSGIFIVEEGLCHRPIFEKSVLVKQLHVAEAHGILLFRTDKGRDSRVHVFRLSDFESEASPGIVRGKADLKDHKLERTKGCHLYALSRPGTSHMRMVVAIGRRLLILQWRHSAAWTAWCSSADTDTVDGFHMIRELTIGEAPSMMTFVESSLPSGDNRICVGYRHQFDLVSEKTGETVHLHQVEASKVHLVAAIDVYEDEEAQLLLCYNHICHFQRLQEDKSTEYDFQWTSVPDAIVCAFPYILAFTSDTIEIRLIINGNLIQTMVMPRMKFITSKSDIYFTTTAPEFVQIGSERVKEKEDKEKEKDKERDSSLSPPSSPQSHAFSGDVKPLRLYRIPFNCLTGTSGSTIPSSPQPPSSGASSEVVSNNRANLTVTMGKMSLCKERNHSASSDSGTGKSLASTSPPSPF